MYLNINNNINRKISRFKNKASKVVHRNIDIIMFY